MNKEIQLLDKVFQEYISEDQIRQSIRQLVSQIEEDYEGQDLLLLPILNGSFMFASDLMKELNRQVAVSFVKVSSYQGNLQTSGRVDELIGLNTSIVGKRVLIIEDIVDTGITIDKVLTLLRAHYPASVEVCTLLYKPDAYEGKNPPKYVGMAIPNRFVVGYGLDYNEYGRNLKEIYQLKEE
jgi:hypoxanthine phosphoribosyltransferase